MALAAFLPDGSSRPLGRLDTDLLEQRFRKGVLRMLTRRRALAEETAEALRGWEHSGFHAHAGDAIWPEETEGLERVAGYIVRGPIALSRIEIADGGQVVYTADKVNPDLGSNRRAFDPLKFIAEATQHIPEPYQNHVIFYRRYSCRTRGTNQTPPTGVGAGPRPGKGADEDPAFVRARRKGWALCIRKVFAQDPLQCPRCDGPMKIAAFLTEREVVDRILRCIGFVDPPQADVPSAVLVELKRRAAGDEASGVDPWAQGDTLGDGDLFGDLRSRDCGAGSRAPDLVGQGEVLLAGLNNEDPPADEVPEDFYPDPPATEDTS